MMQSPRSASAVLAEARGLFLRGLTTAFPWVLAAELVQMLPFAPASTNIFTMDISSLGQPANLARILLCGLIQSALYCIAVLQLARLAGEAAPGTTAPVVLRAVPAVLVGYLAYELVVGFGLLMTYAVFMLGMFIAGFGFGLVICVLPLAPTAAVSTALALFVFPAVLERRGPFASLSESSRLAKTHWGKVALVISVPALMLLVACCIQNQPELARFIHAYLELLHRAAEEGLGMGDVQGLLDSLKGGAQASGADAWGWSGVILGAFAWWYTLAVCYAQYRDLKRGG